VDSGEASVPWHLATTDSNTGPYALIHVHVCVHCGSQKRNIRGEGPLTSSVFLCWKWLDTH
jgi:hypothetical protein